jgi:predicted aldo/keto reductase-like oxidoreductase
VEYRSFGKLDWKPSALGFGTMRLPTVGNDPAQVNEAETIKLIRYAIDHGVNYIDSAFTYHDGNSEATIGKALSGKYRQKTKIATKMPVYQVQTKEDLDRILDLQMKRLQTHFIDFYLFHSLNKMLWQKVKDLDMIGWAERQVAKGRLGYLGFSFHDELEVFKEIVDSYDNWTISQIQYNYLSEKYQAGREGLKYAASKGLAVVIMEPLAGGMLAVNPPAQIQKELTKTLVQRTPVDWALQWIWSQPEVSLALSGMNALQQVIDNVDSACKSAPNTLSAKEIKLLQRASQLYNKCGYIGCTKCRYCSHCSQNIDIPSALAFLNQYSTMPKNPKTEAKIKQEYAQAVPQARRASNCISCGHCEAVCPQHLPVRKLLSEAASHLE